MKICYFGIYDPAFSRNKIYLSGLRKNGVEVVECLDRSHGLIKYFRLVHKYWKIRNSYDVMVVGYPGYTVVWLARLLAPKKLIIFDALCTLHEAQVLSRGIYPLWSFRRFMTFVWDHISVVFADVVLVETLAQKAYFESRFNVTNDKVKVLLTGADDSLFYPAPVQKTEKYTALFRGRFLAEAGIGFIIEAANLLADQEIVFSIVGSGHVENEVRDALARHQPRNIRINSTYLSFDDLRKMMLESNVLLGQFADHERLKRTIPHKAFEALALRMPYITVRAEGHRGFLVDQENCLMVEPANARDLAGKILYLKNNPQVAAKIAQNGYELYKHTATPKVLGQQLLRLCKDSPQK